MKFIISSKYLATKLSEINFDNDNVYKVCYDVSSRNEKTLIIFTNNTTVTLRVDMIVEEPTTNSIKQSTRRWDWLKQLVKLVEDQPVLIRITEHTLDTTFQY